MSATIGDPYDISFFVVIDSDQRHRVWPSFAAAPAGWQVIYGEATCAACLEYIGQEHWAALPEGA